MSTIQNPSGSGSSTDTLNVNGSVVVTPFSITALVNGIGPVGEVKVNGFPAANYQPCMVEILTNQFTGSLTQAPGSIGLQGVVYKNTTGFPILVIWNGFNASVANIVVTANSDATATPSTPVAVTKEPNVNGGHVELIFFVLPGNYWSVTAASTITLTIVRQWMCVTGTFTDSGDIVSSPGRSLSTIYQNNSANTLFVAAQVGTVNANSLVKALSDYKPVPTDVVDNLVQTSSSSGTVTTFFIVPPYHYYEVVAATGTLAHWHEYTWNIPCTKSLDLGVIGNRQVAGVSTAGVSTGAADSTMTAIQSWLNPNPFRVLWVQVSSTSAANGVAETQAFWTDTGMPPNRLASYVNQTGAANLIRMARIPIMPNQFYAAADVTASASQLTTTHWWEYQIG